MKKHRIHRAATRLANGLQGADLEDAEAQIKQRNLDR